MPPRGRRRSRNRGHLSRGPSASVRRSRSGASDRVPDSRRRSARIINLYGLREGDLTTPEWYRLAIPAIATQPNCLECTGDTGGLVRRRNQYTERPRSDNSGVSPTATQTAVAARSVSSAGHLTTSINGGEISGSVYNMSILIEPPQEVCPGNLLHPPVIIRLDQNNTSNGEAPVQPSDRNVLWALASLVTEDGATAVAPPDLSIFRGTLVSSVQTLNDQEQNGHLGFLHFSDLAIQRPGRFRIRFSVMTMNTDENMEPGRSAGVVNLQSTTSRIINVHSNAADVPPSK
ncbi:hypothetical protein MMC09_005869 [Bachmanniomyces sp. S44760]|nr:hypothetical protein [Bachmanniomyces sp. S44760]